jgi:hypothetical protein
VADEAAALLERYNPYLVCYPHEPSQRERPGARSPGRRGWGDYHPCNAEFFLARVHRRDRPPDYSFRDLFRRWQAPPIDGIPALRAKLAATTPERTEPWEIDVAKVPSQRESQAWRAYGGMLGETDDPYACVTYARYVRGVEEIALQYWYLYIYNDFRNNHEADWEMATIVLDRSGVPDRMGLSSHHTGMRRDWPRVFKIRERPVIYVARGSHANYFEYTPKGYPAIELHRGSNAPFPLAQLSWIAQRLPGLRRWRDQPAADPQRDTGHKREHAGVCIEPTVRMLPASIDQPPDSEWWWLRYWGRWGSSGARVAGTIGIDSPWRNGGLDRRWRDPIAWVDRCAPA